MQLMAEDPALFTDGYYGVDYLYRDPTRFSDHVDWLASIKGHDDGDASPWLLYVYGLYLRGSQREAEVTAETVLGSLPEGSVATSIRHLLGAYPWRATCRIVGRGRALVVRRRIAPFPATRNQASESLVTRDSPRTGFLIRMGGAWRPRSRKARSGSVKHG